MNLRKKLYQVAVGSIKMQARFVETASAEWLREELPAGVTNEKWRELHAGFVTELFAGLESLAHYWRRVAEPQMPPATRARLRERWREIGREHLAAATAAATEYGGVFGGEKLVVPE